LNHLKIASAASGIGGVAIAPIGPPLATRLPSTLLVK